MQQVFWCITISEKNSQALSLVWRFYVIHIEINTVKYEANSCESMLFFQSKTHMRVLHSVNLGMYEIKVILPGNSEYMV